MSKFKFRKKRKHKLKEILLILLIFNSVYMTFNYLLDQNINIPIKFFSTTLNNANPFTRKKSKQQFFNKTLATIFTSSKSYKNLVKNTSKYNVKKLSNEHIANKDPLIYIYNSHQREEYASSEFNEYNMKPTVMMASFIMQDIFKKNNYNTIVEEESISKVLKDNNLNYAGSYKASRMLIDNAKINNPSLKHFIDVHRDSLGKDKTTVVINNKSYAKLLFLIGLENTNYEANLAFTNKINDKLNELYPSLSKGIYKKGGKGVNGVYNQDNSPYTILIEVGGNENTISEVLNSTIAFTNAYLEVIKNER